MSEAGTHQALIQALATDLRPVNRVWSPWRHAVLWLAAIAALSAALGAEANLPAVAARLTGAPDMALAALGSTLTALAAIVAACLTAIPGRAMQWGLLPVPPLCLWLAASGLGCLRSWVPPGTTIVPMAETRDCLVFILALSLPLSALTALMLRRSWPVRPGLTTALAGLAVAAAAASLLTLFHPFDASATDLSVHAAAVLIVVLGNRMLAPRVLGTR